MKRPYILPACLDQLTRKNAFKNIFITHNAFGIFSINSHINQHTGKEKVAYPTKESALKSAAALEKKKGVHFSCYKCAFCAGWHIGKNRENKTDDAYERMRPDESQKG